jgi:hypothetical protein
MNAASPAVLIESGGNNSTLQVLHAPADQKPMCLRTLGANGDTQSTMSGGG